VHETHHYSLRHSTMPTISRKDVENNFAILSVSVSKEEIKSKVDKELRNIRTKSAIKGFRPGQAPIDLVRKMYGNALLSDAIQDIFANEVYQYVSESNLEILGQPLPAENQKPFSADLNKMDEAYQLDYEIGHVPTFSIPLPLTKNILKHTVSNLDELAKEDIQHARKRMATQTETEDIIAEDDIVEINATAINSAFNTNITVSVSTDADPELVGKLKKLKKGDNITFDARQVEPRRDEQGIKKYILGLKEDDNSLVDYLFEGVVTKVTRNSLPELDENFFKNFTGKENATESEAIELVKEGIARYYNGHAESIAFKEMRDQLVQNSAIQLPVSFLQRWLHVTNQGKLNHETIERDFDNFADSLRWSLIRSKIIKENNLEVTDEEIRHEMSKKLSQYLSGNIPEDLLQNAVNRMMEDKKNVSETKDNLLGDKLYAFLSTHCTFVNQTVTSHELHNIMENLNAKMSQNAIEKALEDNYTNQPE
jgi:trigger factor